MKIKKVNSLEWVAEPLLGLPDLVRRKMFGLEAIYLGERMVLVLGDGEEPWNGMLLPADRERHAELFAAQPALEPHAILGKWLYLSQAHADFESIAQWAVERIRRRDPRMGTVPPKKKKKGLGRAEPGEKTSRARHKAPGKKMASGARGGAKRKKQTRRN